MPKVPSALMERFILKRAPYTLSMLSHTEFSYV